jgi:hypothetical protein
MGCEGSRAAAVKKDLDDNRKKKDEEDREKLKKLF